MNWMNVTPYKCCFFTTFSFTPPLRKWNGKSAQGTLNPTFCTVGGTLINQSRYTNVTNDIYHNPCSWSKFSNMTTRTRFHPYYVTTCNTGDMPSPLAPSTSTAEVKARNAVSSSIALAAPSAVLPYTTSLLEWCIAIISITRVQFVVAISLGLSWCV